MTKTEQKLHNKGGRLFHRLIGTNSFYFEMQRIFFPVGKYVLSFSFFFSPNATGSVETLDEQTETESVVSFRRERPRHRESLDPHGERRRRIPTGLPAAVLSRFDAALLVYLRFIQFGMRNLT